MADTNVEATGNESLLQQNNPLSRKLNKILETRLDNDKDMLEALKAVSTFFTENNLRTRRNLRGDIERRSLAINQDFLSAFTHVIKELDSIHEDVKDMSECCQDMTQRLKATKEQTQELMTKTSSLRAKGQKLQLRSEVAEAFLSKFQLGPAEAKIFRGARDGNLHPEFFRVLEKVQKIHNDVKVLLRTNQQTAGLEIMEQMALHQESAYERLYRWTQSQCRSLTSDSIDVSEMLEKAMKALQNRPVLFAYTLDEYASARRAAVVRGFIDALTRGQSADISSTSGHAPRPIEMHSHDPLRYVGDMLAWLHQAAASEKEYLSYLLKECVNSTHEEEKSTLGHVLEGVCRPLKVRIEQVLVSDPGSLILFKLTNLIKFYHATIHNILKIDTSPLLEIMDEMYVLCRKLFFNTLNFTASKLLDKVEVPHSDLGPSNTLTQMMQLLRSMLDSHASSVIEIDARQRDFKQIISCLLDPLLQMCAMSASQLQSADMAAYMINCLNTMKSTLSLYEFTDERIEMLSAQIDAHLDTLVNEQAAGILTQGGIGTVYSEILRSRGKSEGALSKQPGLDKQNLVGALSRFDSYLSSSEEFILPQVSFLASATLKEVAATRARDLVITAYKTVYDALIDPKNEYNDVGNLPIKSPEQMKMLLY